ncbi:MAG: recombination mediator RecR [Deltaproteobacteria bacterium]|nr:recombination mediator RecR [Sandaracinaceae bacterium]MCX7808845.1 recombination mediator RecR [Deltaproteobacteria bacterium]MDW8246097.1 recombination mediator RecR [Sandaracinaceae bacterium]
MEHPLSDLVSLLMRLPGVGERTATRFACFLMNEDPSYAKALGEAISTLHDRVRLCKRCANFSQRELCGICADPHRDSGLLCIVARVPDLWSIERSGSFSGRYHVLHALLAPLEGMNTHRLDTDAILERIRSEGVREVIIATPLSVEGEATAIYLAQQIRPLGIRISRIASGIPHGGELEYIDQITLGRAIAGRRDM